MERMGLRIPGEERALFPESGLWPNGKRLAVGITVDCYGSEATNVHHMVASSLDFGPTRGVWNIVEELERTGVKATFNLTGKTAAAYPELAAGIEQAGHEVAVLGLDYAPHWKFDRQREKAVIRDAISAVSDALGKRPRGWRTPQCRPSIHTLPLLAEEGMEWDSSLRNDEIPYLMQYGEGDLVEIPCGGSNDDSSYLGFPYPVTPADNVLSVWRDELAMLHEESSMGPRMAVFSLTPGFAGRRTGLSLLRDLLSVANDMDGTWVATCGAIADQSRIKGETA